MAKFTNGILPVRFRLLDSVPLMAADLLSTGASLVRAIVETMDRPGGDVLSGDRLVEIAAFGSSMTLARTLTVLV